MKGRNAEVSSSELLNGNSAGSKKSKSITGTIQRKKLT